MFTELWKKLPKVVDEGRKTDVEATFPFQREIPANLRKGDP